MLQFRERLGRHARSVQQFRVVLLARAHAVDLRIKAPGLPVEVLGRDIRAGRIIARRGNALGDLGELTVPGRFARWWRTLARSPSTSATSSMIRCRAASTFTCASLALGARVQSERIGRPGMDIGWDPERLENSCRLRAPRELGGPVAGIDEGRSPARSASSTTWWRRSPVRYTSAPKPQRRRSTNHPRRRTLRPAGSDGRDRRRRGCPRQNVVTARRPSRRTRATRPRRPARRPDQPDAVGTAGAGRVR